jgi:hypothetical protein
MNMTLFACSLVLLTALASCHKDGQPNEPASTALPGTVWQLERIDTVNAGTVSLVQADTIYLTFDDNRRLSGASQGLCGNTYFGVVAFPVGDSVRVDSLSSTKIGCPKSLYWDYYELLRKAEHLQRVDAQLSIDCDQKSRRLVFRQIH